MEKWPTLKAMDLTEAEVAYEMRVRVIGQTADDSFNTNATILQKALEAEAQENRDPLFWTLTLSDRERAEEVTICHAAVLSLANAVDQTMKNSSVELDTAVISRLAHYDYRWQRINVENAEESIQAQHDETKRAMAWAKQVLEHIDSRIRLTRESTLLNLHEDTGQNSTIRTDVVDDHFAGFTTPEKAHYTKVDRNQAKRNEKTKLCYSETRKRTKRCERQQVRLY